MYSLVLASKCQAHGKTLMLISAKLQATTYRIVFKCLQLKFKAL
jgi:hypothetical protein